MKGRNRIVLGAVWQYVNQPLFSSYHSSIWDIKLFWHHYQIQFLEKCLLTESPYKSKPY